MNFFYPPFASSENGAFVWDLLDGHDCLLESRAEIGGNLDFDDWLRGEYVFTTLARTYLQLAMVRTLAVLSWLSFFEGGQRGR